MKVEEEVAKILLEIKAVTLNLQKPYRYASGILSPIYTDNRLLMSYPEKRKKIINLMAKKVEDENIPVEIIAGTATAGIPHAAWLAEKLNKPMIYVRKSTKTHGKENLIEGKLEEGKKVLLIEDLVSTGGSSLSSVNAIREYGGKCNHCLAIFTYQLKKAEERFRQAKVILHALTNFQVMIKIAEIEGYLTPKEAEKAKSWNKDPEGWGKREGFE